MNFLYTGLKHDQGKISSEGKYNTEAEEGINVVPKETMNKNDGRGG